MAEIGKQSCRDLRSLVDTLPDPILVTDSTGRVLLINAPAAELLQLAPAQVIGKKTVSVVSDGSSPRRNMLDLGAKQQVGWAENTGAGGPWFSARCASCAEVSA